HALIGEPKNNQYLADGAKVRETFCNELRKMRIEKKVPQRIVQVLTDYLQGNAPAAFSNNPSVQNALGQITGFRQELATLRNERKDYLKDLVQAQKSAIQDRISAKRADLQTQGKTEEAITQDSELKAIEKELKDYQLHPPENKQIAELEHKLEALIRDCIHDEKVFEAYLTCLQDVGQYLLQDELIAIADSLNKRVILFQPGWGASRNQLEHAEITPEGMMPIDLKKVTAKDIVCIYYNGFNHYEKAEVTK
ncbi:MAG: hypothetical protein LLF94_01230, partial [Chlamydiales bacterium]|nr:hypothetical protein [Chlamydiales bacterium]